MQRVKIEAHTEDATILLGYVSYDPSTISEGRCNVKKVLDAYGDLYLILIDANVDLLSSPEFTVADLTDCPILQNWEGIHAVTGTLPNGEQTEYFF